MITAAHCVERIALRDLRVMVGQTSLRHTEDTEQEFAIAHYISHPKRGLHGNFTLAIWHFFFLNHSLLIVFKFKISYTII